MSYLSHLCYVFLFASDYLIKSGLIPATLSISVIKKKKKTLLRDVSAFQPPLPPAKIGSSIGVFRITHISVKKFDFLIGRSFELLGWMATRVVVVILMFTKTLEEN